MINVRVTLYFSFVRRKSTIVIATTFFNESSWCNSILESLLLKRKISRVWFCKWLRPKNSVMEWKKSLNIFFLHIHTLLKWNFALVEIVNFASENHPNKKICEKNPINFIQVFEFFWKISNTAFDIKFLALIENFSIVRTDWNFPTFINLIISPTKFDSTCENYPFLW